MPRLEYILLSILLLAHTGLFAQEVPENPNDYLVIKLVTIDPGDELTMWWGHTGIIVEDTRINAASFYNYGLFSFDQENFMLNFARGRLIFWIGVWDAKLALNYYKRLNRTIRIQTLNLPQEKKLEMAKFLAENVLPQNREYLYDHYFDNCATRVRDLLDKIIDGQLYTAANVPARMKLRDLTRRHTHRNYFMDWLLMFLMNDSIDQPIRRWDEMFLPTELEINIADLSYVDKDGLTRDLVANSTTFYEADGVYIVPDDPPVHWPAGLVTGILLSGLLIISAYLYKKQHRFGKVLLPLVIIGIGVIFGIPGLALFLMSSFTDHIVTYWNENLFLGNPLTALMTVLGFSLLRGKIDVSAGARLLSVVLTGLALLLLPLKLIPSFDQDNLLSICLILPVLISITYVWLKIEPTKPAK
jgi:hypothetical protein